MNNRSSLSFKRIFMIFFILICIMLVNTKKVFANDNKSLEINDINKIWTINFNKEILFDESVKESIKVLDSKNNSVAIILELGSDKKSIKVKPPIDGYKYDETYCLIITTNIKSKNNKNLKKDLKLNFYLKHIVKGIDKDDGLLDDNLIAYEDGYIYFANIEDNYNIYKIKDGGTKKQLVCSESVAKLNVKKGWIYYKNKVDNYFYKIRIDGTNKCRLYNSKEIAICNTNNLVKISDLKHTDDKTSMKVENSSHERDIMIDIEGIFYDVNNEEVIQRFAISNFYFEDDKNDEEISGYYLDEIEGTKELIYLGTVLKSVSRSYIYDNNEGKIGENEITNPNYDKRIKLITSQEHIKAVLNNREKERKEEYKENGYKPLKLVDAYITYDIIYMPEVNLEVKNLTNKTIDAYEMELECYDTYDRPVREIITASNKFLGISQNNELKPYRSQTDTWSLTWYENVTKVKNVKITSVHFTDGTVWRP